MCHPYSTSQVGLATFQVFSRPTWPVATVLESVAPKQTLILKCISHISLKSIAFSFLLDPVALHLHITSKNNAIMT